MAANRFTEFNPQPYVSTYVPLPLEFMASALANKQRGFDSALDEAAKVEDEILKVNAIEEHKGLKKKLIDSTNAEVEALADEIVKTGDTSKVRELKRISKRWQNNPLREELETSFSQHALDAKDVQDSKQKGVYTDVYDPFRGYKGVDDNGGIIGYRARGVKPLENYLPVAEKLIDGIKANGNDGKSYKINDDGTITGMQSGWEGIYQQDIDRVAKNSVVPFLTSKEGRYFIDEQKYYGNNDIEGSAYNYLRQLGNKQLYEKTKSGQSYSGALPRDMREDKNTSTTPFQHYPNELKINKKIENVELIPGIKTTDLFKVDSNGTITWKTNDPKKQPTSRFQNELAQNTKDKKAEQEKINQVTKALNAKWIGTPFEQISKDKGFTEAAQQYLNAVTKATNKDNFTTELKNIDTENLTQEVANSVSPTSTSFVSSGGDLLDLKSAASSYGLSISNEEFSTMDKTKAGFNKGNAGVQITKLSTPTGSYVMKIRDTAGKEAEIPVQSSYEMQTHLKPVSEVFTRMNNGETGNYTLTDGTRTKSSWIQDETGNIKYDVKIYDELNNDQINRVNKLISEQYASLPAAVKKSKTATKEYLEKMNKNMELNIDDNGKVTVEKYLSIPEYSDFKTQELINSGYLPKEKSYKEKEDVQQVNFDFEE